MRRTTLRTKLAAVTLGLAGIIGVSAPGPAHADLPNHLVGQWLLVSNAATYKCLDLPFHGLVFPDTPVTQFDCTAGDNQDFRFDPVAFDGETMYQIRNGATELCLDPPGWDTPRAGSPINLWHCVGTQDRGQLFYVRHAQNATYALVNVASGLCLDVAGHRDRRNDLPVTLWHCDANDDHLWSFYTS